MDNIKYIIIHCSATEQGKDFNIFDIDRWHRERGFLCCGYNYVIKLDGSLQRGRVCGSKGAHTLHYNDCSIGICYIGGLIDGRPADTRTPEQKETLERVVRDMLRRYPGAVVCGHHDLNPDKACPCFDVKEWAEGIGIPDKNRIREPAL